MKRLCVLIVLVCLAPVARAWHGEGHQVITQIAVRHLPGEMPAFFREGALTIADASLDPDIFKKPLCADELHATEYPEHFLDLELLKGNPLPANRQQFTELCFRIEARPDKVGTLPWAILEGQQRLAVCFAEYRQWPENPLVQARTLIYAGLLAHYAQDLCQPLHTTVNYDGIVHPDGAKLHKGIHRNVDALPGKFSDPNSIGLPPMESIQSDVLGAIKRQLMDSHQLVSELYRLADSIPAQKDPIVPDSAADALTRQYITCSASFTAQLYWAAWQQSETIEIPAWHCRQAP